MCCGLLGERTEGMKTVQQAFVDIAMEIGDTII